MIKEAIEKIVMKDDLTYDEAHAVMLEIMGGRDHVHPERGVPRSTLHQEHQGRDHR